MPNESIPDIVVGRLPLYLHTLQRIEQEGQQRISSQELGQRMGISAAQIRKDLSQFGEFGKQGTGYSIPFLIEQIQKILKVNRVWNVVLVGAGDLGHAILGSRAFKNRGFQILMAFDNSPYKIGRDINGFIIEDIAHLEEKVRTAQIKVAIITVPSLEAQSVADLLVKAGVKAILCYSPIILNLPEGIYVEYIDPIMQLQHMTYYL